MTRPLSLAALTVLELTPTAMVRCAAEAGYSHIGIRLIPPTRSYCGSVAVAGTRRTPMWL